MYSLQTNNEDYYGYNSKINENGKRIRRLRRTQVSAEKLYYSRMRSPQLTSKHRTSRESKEFTEMLFHRTSLVHKKSSKSSQMNNKFTFRASQFYQQALATHRQHERLAHQVSSQQSKNEYNLQNQSNYYKIQKRQRPRKKLNSNSNIKQALYSLKQTQPKRQSQSQSQVERYSLKSSKTKSKNNRQSINNDSSKLSINDKLAENPDERNSLLISIDQFTKKSMKIHKEQFNQNQNSIKSSASNMSYSSSSNNLSKISSKLSSRHIEESEKAIPTKESLGSIKNTPKRPQANKIVQKSQINVKTIKNRAELVTTQYMTKKTTQTDESNYSNKNEKQMQNKIISQKDKQKFSNIVKGIKEDINKISEVKESSMISEIKEKSKIDQKGKPSQFVSKTSSLVVKQVSDDLLKSQKQLQHLAKKKSLSSYTFEDVLNNIQQHQCRLTYLYFFTQNTRNIYTTIIKFERYQKLCFLMLKKYHAEKCKLMRCIKGDGNNCLKLTGIQVPNEVLNLYLQRPQIKQKYNSYIDQVRQFNEQLKTQYYRLIAKHQKDKFIKLQMTLDNYSKQIMRLLMQQLSKIYQQLQNEQIEDEYIDLNEKRVIEIVELMFLMSQLSGRPVKQFSIAEDNPNFTQYYQENYERIMETAQFFQKYG